MDPKVEIVNQNMPFSIDWVDSNTLLLDPAGNLVESGTVLLICNNIVFLKPLTEEQLLELKAQVEAAVKHELAKRCNSK